MIHALKAYDKNIRSFKTEKYIGDTSSSTHSSVNDESETADPGTTDTITEHSEVTDKPSTTATGDTAAAAKVSSILHCLYTISFIKTITFTCVSYAEARNRYRLDVCLSVRLSVTCWYCIKMAERIVMISSRHDSPFILVLCVPRSSRNSDGVTPCGGAKYRWGIKIARFSTN